MNFIKETNKEKGKEKKIENKNHKGNTSTMENVNKMTETYKTRYKILNKNKNTKLKSVQMIIKFLWLSHHQSDDYSYSLCKK